MLCVANSDKSPPALFAEQIKQGKQEVITIDVQAELESADMTPQERAELGLEQNGLDELIRASYRTLRLISFFTTGPKESRCWTVKKDSTAPVAGGVIHSDFQDFFIRAEVVQWDVLLQAGGWSESRNKGILRTEGKEYIVQDGDVMVFLHNP